MPDPDDLPDTTSRMPSTEKPQPAPTLVRRRACGALALAAIGAAGLAMLASLLWTGPDHVSGKAERLEPDIASYVGDAACRDCHPTEYARFRRSAHSQTLRPATRAALGTLCPTAGRIN